MTETGTGSTRMTGDGAGERARAIAAVEAALAEAEADYERPDEGRFVVSLPGTHKLSTTCSLLVGDHTLSVNAFVVRRSEEHTSELQTRRDLVCRLLLEKKK